MRKLLVAFYKSLYNADWLKAKRFFPGEAWSYFAMFVFAVAVITTVPLTFALRSGVKEMREAYAKNAPDFVAKIEKGKLSVTKLSQPYVFKADDFALAVDTVSTNTISLQESVSTSKNSVIVSSENITFRSDRGETRTQSWSVVPDRTISKQQILDFMAKVLLPGFFLLSMLAIFLGFYIGFFVVKLYSIFLVAVIATVVAKIFGRNYKFKEILSMALYGVTLSTLVGLVGAIVGVSYLAFITLLAFILAIVYTREDSEQIEE